MKPLGELLGKIAPQAIIGDAMPQIGGVAFDSRTVEPGDVFVAIVGQRQDGNAYIADAVRRGAAAVVSEYASPPADLPVPYVAVADATLALSQLAAALYDHPASRLGVIGVTGTDGKTTTVHLISAILAAAGVPSGKVSTVEVVTGSTVRPNVYGHTTPQAPDIQRSLHDMVVSGLRYAVVEASSHSLALNRVADCEFDVAVFTNLTPEHLDYHESIEGYREAKARLFRMAGISRDKGLPKFGVVNADDPHGDFFRNASSLPVITYGLSADADVQASSVRLFPGGTRFDLTSPLGELEVQSRLVGRFNVYNWLAAIATGIGLGIELDAVVRAVAGFASVPGRMQSINEGQPFSVVVDFAHTPNALAQALTTLRDQTPGRLIVIFGQAGGRDARNRPAMAQVVAKHADLGIVTGDDPYNEDPGAVIDAIAAGFREIGACFGEDYLIIHDRREAIYEAMRMAEPGDTVLIAGRGHESKMVIGSRRVPFDDAQVSREAIAALGLSSHRAA
jgi:UDP-N-acetylmuramoyl-L-alanyl-D-glutamate--2,6-diaminopimelate ligase